ncbi:MAG: tRNA pseudouridine(38-40) synthase TruA [Planctomycetes bacterium]|nr:tRNA pseudouridine(38-40) synthase TruA [Planctomycetota bacterium]
MPKVAIRIAYEGTNFHGWQRQEPPDKLPYRTVQGELDKALADLFQQRVLTSGASRTDAGVHADAQVVAFTVETRIPIPRLPAALNTRLPGDMRVLKAWPPAEDFDPVRDAVGKGYRYEVSHGDHLRPRPIFDRRTVYFSPHHMEVGPMKLAAAMFPGEHDFAAFAHSSHGRESTIRTIFSCEVQALNEDRIVIDISGSGFLYNMVRIIAGTITEIGRGRMTLDSIRAALESGDRQLAGPTLPPEGLRLQWIRYPEEKSREPMG